MDIQSLYQRTIKFAAAKHAEQNQIIPGTNLPYVVHLSNVAMEILMASQNTVDFNPAFAIQVALLHDVLEDTSAPFEEIKREFGAEIAEAVLALTKNIALQKEEKMQDSLNRIKELRKEVWAVKLADRITNLQMPLIHWDNSKKTEYRQEAMEILQELKGANIYLEQRLTDKITEYEAYISA